jgi:hypothetical protein
MVFLVILRYLLDRGIETLGVSFKRLVAFATKSSASLFRGLDGLAPSRTSPVSRRRSGSPLGNNLGVFVRRGNGRCPAREPFASMYGDEISAAHLHQNRFEVLSLRSWLVQFWNSACSGGCGVLSHADDPWRSYLFQDRMNHFVYGRQGDLARAFVPVAEPAAARSERDRNSWS